MLAPLPATPFELAEWKQATVQFNYHVTVDKMYYSVPYQYIKDKVDVRITETTIEIFYHHNRIASHRRLHGRGTDYPMKNHTGSTGGMKNYYLIDTGIIIISWV